MTAVLATAGNNQATITWTPPANAEAVELTDYFIKVTPDARAVKVAAPASSAVVSGLRNGTEYEFTVYAATADGSSEPSEAVRATPSTGMEGEVAGLIVKFEADTQVSEGQLTVPGEEKVDSVDLQVADTVGGGAVLVDLSESVSLTEAKVIAGELASSDKVAWAEPDQFLFTSSDPVAQPVTVPDDSQYASGQWNLWDTYGVGIGDGTDAMTKAWSGGTGTGATVAVIDTGITPHEDLDSQLVSGYDFVSSPAELDAARTSGGSAVSFDGDYVNASQYGAVGRDSNPADPGDWRGVAPTRDSSWHGTKMAGIIAAQARNNAGITGIAPGAKIQPIRALSWRGGLLSDIASSITWASGGHIDGITDNATPSDVINMSFAVQATCPVALQNAIDEARQRGAVLVAAAGNANDDVSKYAPANCNNVITVGATDRSGMRAPYSNYGERIDISAPGGDINSGGVLSTSNTGTTDPADQGYAADQGTSIAAAHVSAAAALIASRDQALTPDAITTAITGKSIRPFANTTCDTDPTKTCGDGILNLAQIATAASGDQDFAMNYPGTDATAVGDGSQSAFHITGAITIEAWTKPVNCSGSGAVIRKWDEYGVICESGSWSYYIAGSSSPMVRTGVPLRYGQWQHIALVRPAGQDLVNFYVDGQLAYTGTTGPGGAGTGSIRTSSDILDVGSNQRLYERFYGQIDEVRLYSAALTSDQIITDMHSYGMNSDISASDQRAYYDFNEGPVGTSGAGTVYNRVSGASSGTNLRILGSPTYADVASVASASGTTTVTFPRSYLTAAGGWRVPDAVTSVSRLVVGGGGSGGAGRGGGGGAGAFVESAATVTAGGVTTVTVGQGGLAARGTSAGARGQSSTFGSTTMSGGGGGAGFDAANATTGGSGGGAAGGNSSRTGAAAGSGLGAKFAGGSSVPQVGGGGGGAASAGFSAVLNATGGSGGSGITSTITGLDYAGGGGGGGHGEPGVQRGIGGAQGAGDGCVTVNCTAGSASANTGSGGGGAGDDGTTNSANYAGVSGAGGSGVVAVRFSGTPIPTGTCSPVTVTSGTTRYVAFKTTTTCDWVVPAGVTALNYLVVAGGGSGGSPGGGGGAGGMIQSTSSVSVTANAALTVMVGSGGSRYVAVDGASPNGNSGGYSRISGAGLPSSATVWVNGGGAGGVTGSNGGSGGGGVSGAGQGTSGQGNAGNYVAGGGAGAAASGVDGGVGRVASMLTPTIANALGVGAVSGGSVYFAGGGGGRDSGTTVYGVGGLGGGGMSTGAYNGNGTDASAYTGGGGGGGGYAPGSSGAGGSGVVVLSYAVACSSTSYTTTTYTVVEFQNAGSCTWTPPSGVNTIDYLLVGAGGGGGADGGGGGGGGSLSTTTGVDISADVDGLAITVGAGGDGGVFTSSYSGSSGGSSTLGIASTTLTAPGGAGGAGGPTSSSGGAGGSGGNATSNGGAGGIGARGGGTSGGAGSAGPTSSLTGTSVAYGGGGGGGAYATSSAFVGQAPGGSGGGGAGAAGTGSARLGAPGEGVDGLGGGGGGGFASGGVTLAEKDAAAGGDGAVIIRFRSASDAPTSVSGSASAPGEITVSWTAPTGYIGAGSISGYKVSQSTDGTNYTTVTDGTCNTSAPISTSTSCTVTGLTAGTGYTFKVATFTSSGSTTFTSADSSASSSVTVYGDLNKFTVTATDGSALGTQTAGTAFNVMITAQDSGSRTVTSFTGTVNLTTTTSIIGTGGGTTATFTSGVLASHAVTLKRAGSSQTVTATKTSGTETGTSASFTVNAGAAAKLLVLMPGETADPGTGTGKTGTATARTAGTSFIATVNAVDANWNLVTSANPTVAITSSDANAALPSNAALSSGTGTFAVTFKTAGTRTVTATDQASSGALTANTSTGVTVNAGAAAKLQVLLPGETAAAGTSTGKTGSPTAQTAGTSFTATINAVDANWNKVTSANPTVAITTSAAYSTLPSNSALSLGTGTRAVTIKSGGSQTITATDQAGTPLAAGTSATVTINSGTASQLQVLLPGETAAPGSSTGKSGSPTAQTAGTAFNVTVNAVDSNWNVVTSVTPTIAITTTDTYAALPSNAALASGTGTFAVTMKTAGSRTITATDQAGTPLTASTSASVTVNAGAASKLQVLLPGETAVPGSPTGKSGSPTATTAGSTVTATVRAVDANWNLVTSAAPTVAITSSDSNATLPSNAALSSGTGSFSVTFKTAGSRTVTATDQAGAPLTADTSAAITVSAGTATKLQVLLPGETAAPGTATGKTGTPTAQSAGSAVTVTVNAVDANWNVVSSATPTVAITSSDSNADLPSNAALVSGTGSFSVTFKTAGSRTVTATDQAGSPLAASTSAAVTVNPGAATKLQVLLPGETAAPGTATGKTGTPTAQTAGTAVSVTVNAVDANWNVVTSATPTVAITSSDSNATLPSNATLASGTGTFSVTLKTAGSRTVTATDQAGSPLAAGTSASVTVNPASASLTNSTVTAATSPVAINGGTSVITVQLKDAYGNNLTTNAGTVAISSTLGTVGSVSYASNGSYTATLTSGTVAGSATVSATFNSSAITSTASVVVNPGVTSLTTSTITAATSPIALSGGTSVITVQLKDVHGNNLTTNAGTVAISSTLGTVGTVSYTSGGAYTATLTSGTVAGTATVSATFNSSAITSTTSVVVSPGTPSLSGSTVTAATSPVAINGGTSVITVQVKDSSGNNLTTNAGTVAISSTLGSVGSVTYAGSGSYTATLTSGTVSGSATVSATLDTGSGASSLTSTATVVVSPGTAAALVVTGSGSQTAGATQNLTITAKDTYGNTATGYTGTKSITFSGANTAAAGQAPSIVDKDGATVVFGTATSLTFTSGVASVAVSKNGVMALYKAETATISVTDGSISSTGSNRLSVTVGSAAASKLGMSTQPVAGASGSALSTQPVVLILDLYGNATTSTATVTVTSSAGTLGGAEATSGKAAVAGTATFTNLTLTALTTTSATLTFASGALTTVTSSAIQTTGAGVATTIAVNAGAGQSATAGSAVATAPSVVVTDTVGNRVSGVSVTFAVATGGGSLASSGTVSTNSSGIATSPSWTLGTTAGSNTLTATSGSLSGSPITFTATGNPGAAASIALTQLAAGALAGSAFTTQPRLTVRDANGNTVTGDASTVVTASVSSGGTLVGIVTATAASGTATFTNLGLIGTSGSSYTVTYSTTSLGTASQSLSVSTGPATKIVLATNAAGATYGNTWTTQPVAQIQDAGGNLVSTDSSTQVTVSAAGATVSGTATRQASSGVVTFSGLSITATPATFTLTYAATGLTSATQSLALGQATQSITFGSLSAKTYGDAAFTVGATASSSLTVAFTSTTTSVCTVSGTTVTIVMAGTCTIAADQSGNANFLAATQVTQSFTVNQASQATLTMSSASSALFGQTVTLAATGGSGTGTLGFSVSAGTCTVSGSTLTLGDAGSNCQVSATKLGDANYTAITSANQTITIGRAGQSVAFTSSVPAAPLPNGTYTPTGSSISTVTGSASGLSPVFTIPAASAAKCSISGGVVTFLATGSCVIEANSAQTTNFTAAATASQTIVIGSLNQNITFAQPANVPFGTASVSMGATASSDLTVTYSRGSGTTNSACTVSTLGAVTILAVGTCEVTAAQAGDSQYAAASSVTRAFSVVAAVASAPTLTSASASDQSITVGFTAPGFTGGVSITAYRLVATPVTAGTTVTSTACTTSPCTITGLVNGTGYTVTVAAINSAGTGAASTASTALTPATAAFAVSGLSATPGNTNVALSWTPLTNAQLGGGSFTRYVVSKRVAGTSSWIQVTNALTTQSTSSYTVTGLDNGTSYDFQLVAITSANTADIPGNTAEVVQYPSTTPSAPRSVTTLASTATDIQVSWQVPLSDGGSALLSPYYAVTITSSSTGAITPVTCVFASVTDRFCSASNLTSGAAYSISVAAINRMGTGNAGTAVYNVPSSDATLSSLVLTGAGGAVALDPVFTPSTFVYEAEVTFSSSTITLTPTTTAAGAVVDIDGDIVASGSASLPIPLEVGTNEITILVTASDPRFDETYELTVTRLPAPPAGDTNWAPSANVPVTPPPAVLNGSVTGAVIQAGQTRADVTMTRSSSGAGWQMSAPDFSISVETINAEGRPVRLAPGGAMQVPQGGSIVIDGAGYLPSSDVSAFAFPRTSSRAGSMLTARGDVGEIYLGSAPVNASGNVSARFIVPSTLPIGDYVFQINGLTELAQVRSTNLALNVLSAAKPDTTAVKLVSKRLVSKAFYEARSDRFTIDGVEKMREIAKSVPKNARNVKVKITGVSVGLESVSDNVVLAGKRAERIADYLVAKGIQGDYEITFTTSFKVGGDRDGATDKADKPLTTIAISYDVPIATT